jgi:hypothetical protein
MRRRQPLPSATRPTLPDARASGANNPADVIASTARSVWGGLCEVRRYGSHAVSDGALAHMPSRNDCKEDSWAESALPMEVCANWLSHSFCPQAVSVG